jgi:hypothetical protein
MLVPDTRTHNLMLNILWTLRELLRHLRPLEDVNRLPKHVGVNLEYINPLTPELNPSAQRCLTRFFTGDFASCTAHFVNICVNKPKNATIIHAVY